MQGYSGRVRDGEEVFTIESFQEVTRAVERHDRLAKWSKERRIRASPFTCEKGGPVSFLEDKPVGYVRIVVGDTYIDEPIKEFPSERLVATIALILQARGEI